MFEPSHPTLTTQQILNKEQIMILKVSSQICYRIKLLTLFNKEL